jgi:ADP-ribosylglycohydrolase
MPKLKPEYIEKIYAGWLAKIIGIRLGAPIEGWTYQKIKNVYGELKHGVSCLDKAGCSVP